MTRPTRSDLERTVFASPQIGDPVSAELVNIVATLCYFAGAVCDREPETLKLGHLVGALSGPREHCSAAHPLRRRTDRPRVA